MSLRRVTVILAALSILAACSVRPSGSQAPVFRPFGGFTLTSPVHTHDLSDAGIPRFQSVSSDPIRVTGARLVSVPGGGREGPTYAYADAQTKEGVYTELGDLPKRCPNVFKPLQPPYPTIRTGRTSDFFLVMTLTMPKPGVYHLPPFIVSYKDVSTGKSGVQVMKLPYTFRVKPGAAAIFPASEC
jgi:hypothetical protein